MTPARRWWGIVPAALTLALVWPERGFVPIWDGRVYLDCVVDAARTGLSVTSLRCGGHHAQLTMGFLALSQLGDPGNTTRLLLANVLLAWAALWAFHAILAVLWPGDARTLDRALLTTVLAVHPLMLASLVQLNTDFGAFVFFLLAMALLWRGERWLGAAAGLMLCFSKETGALAYAVLVATLGVARALGPAAAPGAPSERSFENGRLCARIAGAARQLWPAALPLVAYAAFLGWWAVAEPTGVVWNRDVNEAPLAGLRWFDLYDPVFRSYVAIIFVLGFAWVPSLVSAVALGRWVRGARAAGGARLVRPEAATIVALTALLTYLLTVYRTWSFPRYFLVLMPLLLLCAALGLDTLGAAARTRRVAIGAYALLLLASVRASFDPVSRALFGRWSLGDARVYHVSRLTRDFRVTDADQLAYNLQFTAFHDAQNAAFAALAPTEATTIVFPAANRWGLWSDLDPATHQRVARRDGVVRPRYADEIMIAAMRDRAPRDLWLVEQPNDPDSSALTVLHRRYADADSARYAARGLTIGLRHLVRRESSVVP
ncbi:MAG: hypothetical protein HY059_05765 [Proteobacteria bacterium]|nr:hypothetical protein [Pseudomonadota bacterium]